MDDKVVDENDPHIAAGNIINDILLAHRDKWNGDDEIQDMLAEAFVKGVKFEQESKETPEGASSHSSNLNDSSITREVILEYYSNLPKVRPNNRDRLLTMAMYEIEQLLAIDRKQHETQLLAALDGAKPESKLFTPQYNGGFNDAIYQYQQNIHQLFGEEGK